MATLLEQPKKTVERSTQGEEEGSIIEREILAFLQRPARYPPGIRDLRHELLRFFSELQIQKALLHLLERGAIEIVYTRGFEIGFVLSKPE